MIETPLYAGERIELMAVDAEKDAAILTDWALRPLTFAHLLPGHYHAATESEMKKRLSEANKRAEEKRDCFFFTVKTRQAQEMIGFVQLPWVLYAHQFGRLYIDFGSEADLAAYGDETMQLLLYYAFMEANLFRVSTPLPAYATEILALYERNGFVREVERREAVYHEARYYSELEYGLLRPEYKKAREEAEHG